MKILIINSGSSSIKYQLFDMPAEAPLCSGLVERIGLDVSTITHRVFGAGDTRKYEQTRNLPDHGAGLSAVVELLTDPEKGVIANKGEVKAVGHRVVHGGEAFASTTRITPAVKEKIKSLFALAPLHNPPNYTGVEVAEALFPQAEQVAVFDTAFHQTMSPVAYRTALPKAYYTEMGIRAYGFHGTSHQYVSRKATDLMGKPDARIISIHLGNGCSMAAIRGGKSLDTSMGLGPMGGLVMGTRAGDVDPSIIFHLIRGRGMSTEAVHDLLNRESGLLGLCGHSDMRDVKLSMAAGDPDAKLAYDLYAYRIRKYIGSFVAVLNGLDAVVFTAGVGENDAQMREAVCSGLDCFGIALNSSLNSAPGSEPREVQDAHAKVKIWVIPTNEELEISRQTYALISDKAL